MPVVERVGIHGHVVLRLSNGSEHSLNGIGDNGTRGGVVQLQKSLVKQGTRRSHDETEEQVSDDSFHISRLCLPGIVETFDAGGIGSRCSVVEGRS